MNRFAHFLFLTMFLPVVYGMASAQTSPTIDPALAAAMKREATYRTVEFTFDIDETSEAGSMSAMPRTGPSKGIPFPAKQIRRQSTGNKLLIDGDRYRYEGHHPIPDERIRDWADSHDIEVCDGTTTKHFYAPPGNAKRLNSIANIQKDNQMLVGAFPQHSPIHVFCRGASNRIEMTYRSLRHYNATGLKTRIDGVQLAEYRGIAKHETGNFDCWVDPAAEHVVRRIRCRYSRSEKTKYIVNIRYEIRPGMPGPVPTAWTYTLYSEDGKVSRSFDVNVTSIELKPTLSPERFDIVFPPGLEVSDQRTDTSFLVREDGSWLRLKHAGQRLPSEADELRKGWTRRNFDWIATVIIVSVCVYLVRRWRGRATVSQTALT